MFCGKLCVHRSICIPIVFFTYSRGAMVGLSVISCLMLLQLKQRFIILPVVVVGILIALALFAPPEMERSE